MSRPNCEQNCRNPQQTHIRAEQVGDDLELGAERAARPCCVKSFQRQLAESGEGALLRLVWLPERIFTNQCENAVFGTPVVYGPHWGHNRLTIVYCQLTIVNRRSRAGLLLCDVCGWLYPPNSTMSAMRSASVSGSASALFARMITENRCSGNRRISVLNPTVLPS
jgi:hypothetical protein